MRFTDREEATAGSPRRRDDTAAVSTTRKFDVEADSGFIYCEGNMLDVNMLLTLRN